MSLITITPEEIIARHTVVIHNSNSSCGNCGFDIVDYKAGCRICNTTFAFMADGKMRDDADLAVFASDMQGNFPGLVFVGMARLIGGDFSTYTIEIRVPEGTLQIR